MTNISVNKRKDDVKICVACSAGGHFSEAIKATAHIKNRKYYVTYRTLSMETFSQNNTVYFVTHPRHSILPVRLALLLRNCVESLYILMKERPDLIISTGADAAVATCILGKMIGAKLIYIESGGYVTSRSLSGRLVYPFADLFLVQWKPALRNFPRAKYGGPLF